MRWQKSVRANDKPEYFFWPYLRNRTFIAWSKPRRMFGRIREQISASRVFACSRILTNFAEAYFKIRKAKFGCTEFNINGRVLT